MLYDSLTKSFRLPIVSFANAASTQSKWLGTDADHLQMFHYIAIIVGVVIFVLSFFDFAGILYDVKLLFVTAVLAIFAAGAMMVYATYIAFNMSCKSAFNSVFDTASLTGQKNVIEANDEVGISIVVLDLVAALLLISAAISFSRTY